MDMFRSPKKKKELNLINLEEIDRRVEAALADIGEIKPRFDENRREWYFEHMNYKGVEAFS